jgi:hypothetical protein
MRFADARGARRCKPVVRTAVRGSENDRRQGAPATMMVHQVLQARAPTDRASQRWPQGVVGEHDLLGFALSAQVFVVRAWVRTGIAEEDNPLTVEPSRAPIMRRTVSTFAAW